jgi:hypothetical protein
VSERDAFEIPTTPIASGREGRPWLVVMLLVVAVAGAFVVARWSSNADRSGQLLTSRPTLAIAEAKPVATPLPLLQWFTGPEAPLDDVLLEAGHVRRLRLAGARVTEDILAQPGRDLLLPSSRGGTVCLCWNPSGSEASDSPRLQLVRRDADHVETSRTTITAVDGLDLSWRQAGPTFVALEPSPDGRFAYLARAVRSSTRWQVSLDVIDLARARIVDTLDLMTNPDGDRNEVASLDGPTLRVAPDGRHLLVAATVSRVRVIGPDRITPRAWIVGLDDARFAGVADADGVVAGTGPSCEWIDFATSDIVAQGCRTSAGAAEAAFEIRRHDLEGRDLGALLVGPWPPVESGYPLIDVTRGVVYAWDPDVHSLRAVNVVSGVQRDADTSATEAGAPASVIVNGARPTGGSETPTAWSDGRATIEARGERMLVGSPDGRLVFAIGAGSEPDGSSGVWVFETATLEVIERWPALASYASLSLLEQGRWLAAIGRPGVTAAGDLAAWGTSLTIHDTTSGRPILRIGDLGTGTKVTFPWSDAPVIVQ